MKNGCKHLILCTLALLFAGCVTPSEEAYWQLPEEGLAKPEPETKPPRVDIALAGDEQEAPESSRGLWPFGRKKGNPDADPEPKAAPPPSNPSDPTPDVKPPTRVPDGIYRLKPLDPIIIRIAGPPDATSYEDIIDEEGHVNLNHLEEPVLAAGKTGTELERHIRKLYLDTKIYKRLSVTVIIPAKFYTMQGEVVQKGNYPVIAGITLGRAVAIAGGFTPFADMKRVTVIRASGQRIVTNVRDIKKGEVKDIKLEAGDIIQINKSIL